MKLENAEFINEEQWYRVLREERYQFEDSMRKWALKEIEKQKENRYPSKPLSLNKTTQPDS